MFTVLIPDGLEPSSRPEAEVFGDQAVIVSPATDDVRAIDRATWAQADAILVWHRVTLDARLIVWLERCRVIVRVGVGFDNVDLSAAGRRGIKVCNVPDYGTNEVADHAVGLFLSLARGIVAYDEAVRAGSWRWHCADLPLRRVSGLAIGLIGLGRIGTAMARRLLALGAAVSFYDPYKEDGYDKALGLRRAESLQELLEQSDVLSVHVPLTNETLHLINETFVRNMKRGALLINTARGKTMDLDAVYDGLRSGKIGAAALDVLPDEPPDPDHPLLQAWRQRAEWLTGRLIITPHVAFYDVESFQEMRSKAAREAMRVLQGFEPRNCVNRLQLRCTS